MAFATSVECAAPQFSTKEDPKSRSMLGLWTRTTWSARPTRPGSAEESGGYPAFPSIIDMNVIASEARLVRRRPRPLSTRAGPCRTSTMAIDASREQAAKQLPGVACASWDRGYSKLLDAWEREERHGRGGITMRPHLQFAIARPMTLIASSAGLRARLSVENSIRPYSRTCRLEREDQHAI